MSTDCVRMLVCCYIISKVTDAKEISTFRPALNTLKAKDHRCSHKTWLERSQVEYYKICKTGKSFLKIRRNTYIKV